MSTALDLVLHDLCIFKSFVPDAQLHSLRLLYQCATSISNATLVTAFTPQRLEIIFNLLMNTDETSDEP